MVVLDVSGAGRGKRTLSRRIRRQAMGGRFDLRVYDDGTMHIRLDHPSNDPGTELAMVAASLRIARRIFADAGLGLNIGPITWRDDP